MPSVIFFFVFVFFQFQYSVTSLSSQIFTNIFFLSNTEIYFSSLIFCTFSQIIITTIILCSQYLRQHHQHIFFQVKIAEKLEYSFLTCFQLVIHHTFTEYVIFRSNFQFHLYPLDWLTMLYNYVIPQSYYMYMFFVLTQHSVIIKS